RQRSNANRGGIGRTRIALEPPPGLESAGAADRGRGRGWRSYRRGVFHGSLRMGGERGYRVEGARAWGGGLVEAFCGLGLSGPLGCADRVAPWGLSVT